MTDILIAEEATGEPIEWLKARWQVDEAPGLWRDPAALRERVRGVRALMVRNQTLVDTELLAAAERLAVGGWRGGGGSGLGWTTSIGPPRGRGGSWSATRRRKTRSRWPNTSSPCCWRWRGRSRLRTGACGRGGGSARRTPASSCTGRRWP